MIEVNNLVKRYGDHTAVDHLSFKIEKGLSETCNRIYKLQDVDVLFQCLLMDQMDWEEEKLYVQFSTIYLLKQTVKN